MESSYVGYYTNLFYSQNYILYFIFARYRRDFRKSLLDADNNKIPSNIEWTENPVNDLVSFITFKSAATIMLMWSYGGK